MDSYSFRRVKHFQVQLCSSSSRDVNARSASVSLSVSLGEVGFFLSIVLIIAFLIVYERLNEYIRVKSEG